VYRFFVQEEKVARKITGFCCCIPMKLLWCYQKKKKKKIHFKKTKHTTIYFLSLFRVASHFPSYLSSVPVAGGKTILFFKISHLFRLLASALCTHTRSLIHVVSTL
jgi:hypothetical protein